MTYGSSPCSPARLHSPCASKGGALAPVTWGPRFPTRFLLTSGVPLRAQLPPAVPPSTRPAGSPDRTCPPRPTGYLPLARHLVNSGSEGLPASSLLLPEAAASPGWQKLPRETLHGRLQSRCTGVCPGGRGLREVGSRSRKVCGESFPWAASGPTPGMNAPWGQPRPDAPFGPFFTPWVFSFIS